MLVIGLTPTEKLPKQTLLQGFARSLYILGISFAILILSASLYAFGLSSPSISIWIITIWLQILFLTHDTVSTLLGSIGIFLVLPASRFLFEQGGAADPGFGSDLLLGMGLVVLPLVILFISRAVKRWSQWSDGRCLVLSWLLAGPICAGAAFSSASELGNWILAYKIIAFVFFGVCTALIAIMLFRSRKVRAILLSRTEHVEVEAYSVVDVALLVAVMVIISPLGMYLSVGMNTFASSSNRVDVLTREDAIVVASLVKNNSLQLSKFTKAVVSFVANASREKILLPADLEIIKGFAESYENLINVAIVKPSGAVRVLYAVSSYDDRTLDVTALARESEIFYSMHNSDNIGTSRSISDIVMVNREEFYGGTIVAISGIENSIASHFSSELFIWKGLVDATTDAGNKFLPISDEMKRFLSHPAYPAFALPGFVTLARAGGMYARSDVALENSVDYIVTARISLLDSVNAAAKNALLIMVFWILFLAGVFVFLRSWVASYLNRILSEVHMISHWFADPSPDKNLLRFFRQPILEIGKLQHDIIEVAKISLSLLKNNRESELRASQSLDTLEQIVDMSSSAYFFSDRACNLRSYGANAQKKFGWTSDNLGQILKISELADGHKLCEARMIGDTLDDTVNGDIDIVKLAENPCQLVVDLDYQFSIEVKFAQDGEVRTYIIICNIVDVIASTRQDLMWEVIDATEYAQQLSKLEHAHRLSLMGQTATGIAHELNQPLNVISLSCSNIENKILTNRCDEEFLEKKIARIRQQVERAAKLVDSMRAQARFSTGGEEEVDLNNLLLELGEVMTPQLVVDSIKLTFLSEDKLPTILVNETHITQVLTNLILNARDALLTSELEVKDRIVQLVAKSTDKKVIFEVSNRGSHIDSDVMEKLFDPFFTTKVLGKGTGLGLSICSSMAKRLGGDITVISNTRETVFTFWFPFRNYTTSQI